MPRIAVAFLVDARGHVLLQHRDEHAPRAANQWGMVGGHVEDGEDYDSAMRREILEETGIEVGPDDIELWQATEFCYSDGHRSDYRVYAGRVDLTDDDIVLGEGRAIVFVDPDETPGLDLAESSVHFLPLFLSSDLYRRLREGQPGIQSSAGPDPGPDPGPVPGPVPGPSHDTDEGTL